MDEVRYNGRERSGDKRRVFVCRLTNGRVAVLSHGMPDEMPPEIFCDLTAAKEKCALLVPDIRVPVYEEHELKAVRRLLAETSATATV